MFIADDLGAWLVALLADRGGKRLTTVVLGSDQERALRQAAKAAVQFTAQEMRPDDDEQAAHLARVVSEVFSTPAPDAALAEPATILEALQAGIARQLAVLDDVSLTGTGKSSADVLGLSASVLAKKLTSHLLREILVRGSRGGPLFPLASQLNDDATHLQGERIENLLRQLARDVMAMARPITIPTAVPPPVVYTPTPNRLKNAPSETDRGKLPPGGPPVALPQPLVVVAAPLRELSPELRDAVAGLPGHADEAARAAGDDPD